MADRRPGRMNTTPSMKYLPKYFETDVKGYSLATLMKVFLISEEIMQSRRFYGPMSSVQYCHAYNFHCAKDEAFSQIGFYRAKASVFVCVYVCVGGGGGGVCKHGLVIHLDYRWTNW